MLHWDNAPFFRITRYSGKPLPLRFRRVIFQLPQPLIRGVLHHIQHVCPHCLNLLFRGYGKRDLLY